MFQKSNRRLTSRKKIILWGGVFLVLLVSVLTIVLVAKVANQKKEDSSISLSKEQLALTQTKNQEILQTQNLISNKKIKESDLLTKLKEENLLKPNETDWKNCFNLEVANSPDKLDNLKKKILTIVNNWPGTPSPGPSDPQNPTPTPQPGPGGPSPSPTPEIPPTDKWEKILWEIRKFMDTNPTSLKEMKDWVKNQNYPDPLAGVDLKGASVDELRAIPDRGKVPGIEKVPHGNPAREYRDYVQLSAAGDGNCFLNSFSVFLTGKENDTSLTMPLKVKLCLEYILTEGFHGDGANILTPAEMKDKINGSYGFAKPGAYLESTDIVYMFLILKRPIAMVTVINQNSENWGDKLGAYEYPRDAGGLVFFTPNYPEKWVVYNSGNHFQPLIRK